MLLYHALYQKGESSKARTLLKKLLKVGEQAGFIGSWGHGGPLVLKAIDSMLQSGVMDNKLQSYATRILSVFHDMRIKESSRDGQDEIIIYEQLTARENEVLKLAGKGLTNGDIAEELEVSLATIKYHLQQIYQKLQVHRRSDALSKARATGLLNDR